MQLDIKPLHNGVVAYGEIGQHGLSVVTALSVGVGVGVGVRVVGISSGPLSD